MKFAGEACHAAIDFDMVVHMPRYLPIARVTRHEELAARSTYLLLKMVACFTWPSKPAKYAFMKYVLAAIGQTW